MAYYWLLEALNWLWCGVVVFGFVMIAIAAAADLLD